MSEVGTVLKLVMVMPATNAVSERSASALRRVKTYLRTTMKQARLNSLMIIHMHKERTDTLSMEILSARTKLTRAHTCSINYVWMYNGIYLYHLINNAYSHFEV